MRKNVLFGFLLLVSATRVTAQNVNIPDANFKTALVNNFGINTNQDSEIQLSEALAFSGQMYVGYKSIVDMTGVEAFVNLTILQCNNNNITSLDVSALTNLTMLACGSNPISSLDVSTNVNLTSLSCNNTYITGLDVSNNTALTTLSCYQTQLASLDVSNNILLTNLSVFQCNLTAIDVSMLDSLENIFVRDNQLTSLDLSHNGNLNQVHARDNNFSFVNLANGNNTAITAVDLEDNPALTCIKVDDAQYCVTNWIGANFVFDSIAGFDAYCCVLSPDVTQNGIVLAADIDSASYQWIDCVNSTQINGETNQSFTPTANGSYAVIVTLGNCIDTSACFTVSSMDVLQNSSGVDILIFPNPAADNIQIVANSPVETVWIIDAIGQVVQLETKTNFSIADLSSGVYIIRVKTDLGLENLPLIKN